MRRGRLSGSLPFPDVSLLSWSQTPVPLSSDDKTSWSVGPSVYVLTLH